MPQQYFPYATAMQTHSVKAVVPRQGNIKFPKYSLCIHSFIHFRTACPMHVTPLGSNLSQNLLVARLVKKFPFFTECER